jgi:hypothetical protein
MSEQEKQEFTRLNIEHYLTEKTSLSRDEVKIRFFNEDRFECIIEVPFFGRKTAIVFNEMSDYFNSSYYVQYCIDGLEVFFYKKRSEYCYF